MTVEPEVVISFPRDCLYYLGLWVWLIPSLLLHTKEFLPSLVAEFLSPSSDVCWSMDLDAAGCHLPRGLVIQVSSRLPGPSEKGIWSRLFPAIIAPSGGKSSLLPSAQLKVKLVSFQHSHKMSAVAALIHSFSLPPDTEGNLGASEALPFRWS